MRDYIIFADSYNGSYNDNYRVKMRMSGAGFEIGWNQESNHGLGGNSTDSCIALARDFIGFIGADKVYFNQNVGIGTTTPKRQFHIYSNGSASRLQLSTNTSVDSDQGGFQLACGTSKTAYLYQKENADLVIETNATERMRILAGGNVGIGTTQTDANLQVHGTTNSSTKISAGNGWAELNISPSGSNSSYLTYSNKLIFYQGRDIMSLTNDGKLGILTNDPKMRFDISNVFMIDPFEGYYTDIAHNINYTTGWVSTNGGPGSLIRLWGGSNADSSIRFYTSTNIAQEFICWSNNISKI